MGPGERNHIAGLQPRSIAVGGRQVVLRAAVPDDRDAIVACYTGLDDDARVTRFHSMMSNEVVTAFVDQTLGRHYLVVIATVVDGPGLPGERVVGVAECQPADDHGFSDLGIIVATEMRGMGLGRPLLDALADHARANGVDVMTADVLSGNRAMLALLRSWGCAVIDGSDPARVSAWLATDHRMPSWPPRREGERRLLLEAAGWPGPGLENELRAGAVRIALCRGPLSGKYACALLADRTCPTATGADAVLFDLRLDEQDTAKLVGAHRRERRVIVRRHNQRWEVEDPSGGRSLGPDTSGRALVMVLDQLLGDRPAAPGKSAG